VPVSGWRILLITLLLVGWWPIVNDLRWAQLNPCLLAMFLGAWLVLRQGRDITGGILLGGLAVLKLAGWPIVLWLIVERRWKAVWAAGLVWTLSHVLAIEVHGWAVVRDYYLKVGPQVSAIYRGWETNFSAWTIGQRLFASSGEVLQSTPLWQAPLLARIATIAIPLLIAGLAVRAARRLQSFDSSFALLMAIGIVLNPVAWQHYLMIAAPALVLLAMRLRQLGWPPRSTAVVALLFVAMSVPVGWFRLLARRFAVGLSATGQPIVPALPALLTMSTGIALCALLWLFVKLEPKYLGLRQPALGITLAEIQDSAD
jgi:hypothetical protein